MSASSFTVTRTFVLPEDTTTPATEADGPGLPNYVQAVTITPDGRGAWVPSKKDNIRRGTGPGSVGLPFGHDSRLRTIVSKLDLVGNTVDLANRKDINDSDMANAVELTATRRLRLREHAGQQPDRGLRCLEPQRHRPPSPAPVSPRAAWSWWAPSCSCRASCPGT